ncbi:MAG: LCP family protein, partial [Anaerolineaceae bacterium]|nr:LCP family protein [Anaerolineaceae bacterium]
PTPTPQPLCGNREVMYILGVGADSRADNYLYGLADVIRVARVDFVTPGITVLSIPRDLWVEIPDISDHYGFTHGKLNQSYLYGGPGMGYYDGPGGGAGLLARTLAKNFDLRVDRYAAVNMSTFVRIVDALGGIDITLEEDVDGRPIDDTTEDMGYFSAGNHHLSGEAALRLSRVRKKYSVFKRSDNQTLVLCAIREKLLSADVLPKIPKLVSAFQGALQTDLSLAEISQLLCLLPQVSKANLRFVSFPQEMFTPSRAYDPVYKINTFVWEVDFQALRQMAADFNGGNWRVQSTQPGCP